jgi:hypothetical protein
MGEYLHRLRIAKSDLREWMMDNPGDNPCDNVGDVLYEIADGAVPVYTYDTLKILMDYQQFCYMESEIGGEKTIIALANSLIYQEISRELWCYSEEVADEIKDLRDRAEDIQTEIEEQLERLGEKADELRAEYEKILEYGEIPIGKIGEAEELLEELMVREE